MAPTFPLPTPSALQGVLTGLLGRVVEARKAPPTPIRPAGRLVVGVYGNDDEPVAGICATDVAVANNAGAALSLIPASVAGDGTKAGTVPENLAENFREVLNVVSQVLNSSTTPRVSLQDVYMPPLSLPKPVAGLLAKPMGRLDLTVDIKGYGPGKMAFIVR